MATIPGACLIYGKSIGGFAAWKMNPRYILWLSCFTGAAFIGATACANESDITMVVIFIIIVYLFIGFQEAVCGTFASMSLRGQREIGTGGDLAGSARSGKSGIGPVLYDSMLRNSLSSGVTKNFPVAATGAGLPRSSVAQLIQVLGGRAKAASVPGLTPEILMTVTHAYRRAPSIAFRNTLLMSLGFAALAIFCSLFVPAIDKKTNGIVAGMWHNAERANRQTNEE